MEITYIITGLIVGLAVGLTGIGGGSLMTPILVLGFGMPAAIAVGTDLLYASLTKLTGVWVYGRQRIIQWKVVGLLLAGSIPGSVLTITLLKQILEGIPLDRIINPMLGIALIVTALALFFKEKLRKLGRKPQLCGLRQGLCIHRNRLTVIVGLILGVLVTLSSIGAGALGTIVLIALYPHLATVCIVATELAHAVILAMVAGIGHWHLGTVDFSLLTLLLIGSVPGVYIGSHLGVRLPDHYVRPVLASMLLFVGLRFAL